MRIVLGLVLTTSLLMAGVAHAVISHEHGEHHHEGESSVWQSLHAALRHEEKQMPVILNALMIVGAVLLLMRFFVPRRLAAAVEEVSHALKRGIVPHRRFG